MEPAMRSVYSTSVNAVGYDEENAELYVEWHSGRVSIYSGVPLIVFDQVSNAPSVGSAMLEVKKQYKHRYA
jgi:hypothetical protein